MKGILRILVSILRILKKYQYGLDYLFNEHKEEDYTPNNDINAINDVGMLLSELRSYLSREEISRIRKKLYGKKAIYNFLKEQEDSLTNKEKRVLKNIGRYPKNIAEHLKNLKKHFKKLQKYQYGLDYLFNEHNGEDHTTKNDINVFKEARKLLNERGSNFYIKKQRELEKNSIE